MEKNDQLFRYSLAKNFPKYTPFSETLDHLNGVELNFTPMETATHFLHFWRTKFENVKNNLLTKNLASAFNEQYFLAHQRFLKVKNGFKLTLTDFCGENLTFFEKNCPQFAVAIFLMETFHKDPYMLFEKPRDFVDSHEKNDIFEPLGDSVDFLQNNDTFEKMGDVGSQEKNEILENLGDFADSHPKNGKFPITGD